MSAASPADIGTAEARAGSVERPCWAGWCEYSCHVRPQLSVLFALASRLLAPHVCLVRPEWQLVNTECLLTEAFASSRPRDVLPHVFQSQLLHLQEDIPSFALIRDRFLEPGELF